MTLAALDIEVRYETHTAVRPTSVSTPTEVRRRFDQRRKNAVSAMSIAAAPRIAIQFHGLGRTVRQNPPATIVTTSTA